MNRTPLKTKHSRELSAAKKLILLLSVLPLWGQGGLLFAQSCVSVRQVSTNYATKQITFDLTWGTCNNSNHLYRVWVFADYQPVAGLTKGAWSRATITGTNVGTLHNNTGIWVTGTAGATQRVTLTLSGVPAQFNWCAVAVDYPPNALINAGGGYTLRGTPPFIVNGSQLGTGVRTYSGACITTITDATGNPEGRVPALPAVTTTNPAAVCAGTNVTLTATPSGGTTTANTYTWNIGGATTTTTTNTFTVPAASITTSKTFTVSVRNANGCTSTVSNTGTITVNVPGTAGQSSSPCCCAGGLQNCSGTCQATGCGSGNGSSITNCSTTNITFTSGFVSTQTWVVGSQTWSAPVTATYCRKTNYNGGSFGAYATDCRANNGTSTAINATYGDLFSWCMVAKFATTICPPGWHVPTTDEFCTLDKTLNSRSNCLERSDATSFARYISYSWGGQYSGRTHDSSLLYQGTDVNYWSRSEYSADYGYDFYLYNGNNLLAPQGDGIKNAGLALRCIK